MFTCVTFSFSALPFERAVRLIALLELERVDVDCYMSSRHVPASEVAADPQAAAERIRRATEEAEVGVSQLFFTFGLQFADRAANSPDREVRRENERITRAMAMCARLCGAQGLTTLPGVVWPDEGHERSLALAAEGLRPLVAIAHDVGLPLQIEPHLDSVADTPERTRLLVEQTPGLRLTLDYSHFLAQGHEPDAVHPLLPLAGHFHARHAARGHLQTRAQDSELDFEDIFRRLQACGYRGDICLEPTPGGEGWGGAQQVDVVTEIAQLRDVFRTAQARRDLDTVR
jgi:sugar phosphate isomerase/epimerase